MDFYLFVVVGGCDNQAIIHNQAQPAVRVEAHCAYPPRIWRKQVLHRPICNASIQGLREMGSTRGIYELQLEGSRFAEQVRRDV